MARRPTTPRRQVGRPAPMPAAPVVATAPKPLPNTRDYGKAEPTVPAPSVGFEPLRGL